MMLLGRVKLTNGPVELDYSGGIFTTSSTYHDVLTGELRYTIIPEGRDSAHEWYELMAVRGMVFGEFPEKVRG